MDGWTWGEVLRIAGGGFGVTILVLIILSIAIWILGTVMQKIKVKSENKE